VYGKEPAKIYQKHPVRTPCDFNPVFSVGKDSFCQPGGNLFRRIAKDIEDPFSVFPFLGMTFIEPKWTNREMLEKGIFSFTQGYR
jgi:hypothetical protein